MRPIQTHGLLPFDPQTIQPLSMPHRSGSYFHLHLISDATGETLMTVARAAAAQYAAMSPVEHMHALVRTSKQLERVLTEIEEAPGIVLYTLLDGDLTRRLEEKCKEFGLPCLLVLRRLQEGNRHDKAELNEILRDHGVNG